MMREEFYHSQYGDPEQHYCAVNSLNKQVYEETVEIVTADDRELKERTSESFLWSESPGVSDKDITVI